MRNKLVLGAISLLGQRTKWALRYGLPEIEAFAIEAGFDGIEAWDMGYVRAQRRFFDLVWNEHPMVHSAHWSFRGETWRQFFDALLEDTFDFERLKLLMTFGSFGRGAGFIQWINQAKPNYSVIYLPGDKRIVFPEWLPQINPVVQPDQALIDREKLKTPDAVWEYLQSVPVPMMPHPENPTRIKVGVCLDTMHIRRLTQPGTNVPFAPWRKIFTSWLPKSQTMHFSIGRLDAPQGMWSGNELFALFSGRKNSLPYDMLNCMQTLNYDGAIVVELNADLLCSVAYPDFKNVSARELARALNTIAVNIRTA